MKTELAKDTHVLCILLNEDEWHTLCDIEGLDVLTCEPMRGTHLYEQVFLVHGRFDDKVRNNFLCPLMDSIRMHGFGPVMLEVQIE